MKNVGINVPTAVCLNRALRSTHTVRSRKVRCCFGCNTWFLLTNAATPVWLSVPAAGKILGCYVSQTQMPKTNNTICFQPSGVIEFFPLSPAFQNPHVGQAWITCIRPCYLHRSSAVNWSLRLSDVLNLCPCWLWWHIPPQPYLAVDPMDAGTWIKQGFPHCNVGTCGLNFEINKSVSGLYLLTNLNRDAWLGAVV